MEIKKHLEDFLKEKKILDSDKKKLFYQYLEPSLDKLLQEKWEQFTQEECVTVVPNDYYKHTKMDKKDDQLSDNLDSIDNKDENNESIVNHELVDRVDIVSNISNSNLEDEKIEESYSLRDLEKIKQSLNNINILLPNAKVGTNYSFFIDMQELDTSLYIEIKELEETGLSFDVNSNTILGVPTKAGEFNVIILFKTNKNDQVGVKNCKFFINPDPKSLWKDIPTNPKIPYFKTDEDSSYVNVQEKHPELKNIIAASKRGRSHAHEGNPRDDDFFISFDEDTNWYIMVAADGAGSAKYSRKGSEIATKVSSECCLQYIKANKEALEKTIKDFEVSGKEQFKGNNLGRELYEILVKSAHAAFVAIKDFAHKGKDQTKDYATTLILTICKRFDFGWFVGTFWIGDGGVGIFHKETSYLKVLGEADGGEFAGQTRFITMPEMWSDQTNLFKRIRFDIVNDFTSVILMTDGITDPKFETDANINQIEKWDKLWTDLGNNVPLDSLTSEPIKSGLVEWLDFWSQGNHDDRTIVILY